MKTLDLGNLFWKIKLGGNEHWAVNYTGTQSCITKLPHLLDQKPLLYF